jgi:hypothetical protein
MGRKRSAPRTTATRSSSRQWQPRSGYVRAIFVVLELLHSDPHGLVGRIRLGAAVVISEFAVTLPPNAGLTSAS